MKEVIFYILLFVIMGFATLMVLNDDPKNDKK
jgi:hypothetical protein